MASPRFDSFYRATRPGQQRAVEITAENRRQQATRTVSKCPSDGSPCSITASVLRTCGSLSIPSSSLFGSYHFEAWSPPRQAGRPRRQKCLATHIPAPTHKKPSTCTAWRKLSRLPPLHVASMFGTHRNYHDGCGCGRLPILQTKLDKYCLSGENGH